MTSREIIELKKNIRRYIARKDLKEAFVGLTKLTANTQDWRMTEEVAELETNYKYMLHYLFEGVEDPERENVYRNLIKSLYEITDDAADELLKIESSNFFYERLRVTEAQDTSIKEYQSMLEDVLMSISVTSLLEETNESKKLLIQRERITDNMFNAIYTSARTDVRSVEDYYHFLDSTDVADRDKCLFITAISLNIFHRFDSLKMQVLLHAIKSGATPIRARAMVGLVIVLQMYDSRCQLYPDLKFKLDELSDDPSFKRTILTVIIQLIRSRETEEISRKLTEEIIPKMMKFSHKAGKKLNMEDLTKDMDFAEKNPEWQKEIEDSGLSKQLEEYSHLQMEGADVFHSTFAHLKNFPFFSDVSNWFIPFDPAYSTIAPLFKGFGKDNLLNTAIVDSGHMCNSDKYSFCLSLLQISSAQRELMMGRMNAESEEIKQLQKEAKGTNPNIDSDVVTNQYIQDLYRFYKLHPRKASFFDIFTLSIDFYSKKTLYPLISDTNSLKKIALFCFEKNNFKEALELLLKLSEKENCGDNIWQKIGYCYQMQNEQEKALEAYLKADLITPNNSWITRHIAQLYRNMKELDNAIYFYKKAVQLTPDNLRLELNIGHCYLEKDDYEAALNSYFKVEMLDANSDKAFRPIAWTAFLLERYDLSEKYYKRILNKKPTEHDYLNAGHVELCLGNKNEAINLYKICVEMNSIDTFTELFYADLHILTNKGVSKNLIPFLIDQIKYSLS